MRPEIKLFSQGHKIELIGARARISTLKVSFSVSPQKLSQETLSHTLFLQTCKFNHVLLSDINMEL